jgi:hypothetical protein
MDTRIPLVTLGAQLFDELEPQIDTWEVAIKDFDGLIGGFEINKLVHRLRCHGLYRSLEALDKLRVGVSAEIIYCKRICLAFENSKGTSGARKNSLSTGSKTVNNSEEGLKATLE